MIAEAMKIFIEVELGCGTSRSRKSREKVKDILIQSGLHKALKGKSTPKVSSSTTPEVGSGTTPGVSSGTSVTGDELKSRSVMSNEDWEDLNLRAASAIHLCLAKNILANVHGISTAKKLWEKLEESYQTKGVSNRSREEMVDPKELEDLSKGYLVEQQWFSRGYMPPLDEYLDTAILTWYFSATISSFAGMGEIATKEGFEWAMKFPKMSNAFSVVCRMVDDIVSREFEQKRGHVASGIDCHVKEFGASEEKAYKKFREMVTAAWKDMNRECMKPSALQMALLIRPIHFACVIEVLYM
ncbi:hypothetical protein ACLOJK_039595 [Asimina triloba]